MRRLRISGGKPVSGEVALSGAKNAATKMMVAALLTEEEVVLENVPSLGDTEITQELCEMIGASVSRDAGTLSIKTPSIKTARVTELTRRNRVPILALGVLLHRAGEAEIPLPEGDKIGARPVDFHLGALERMGAEVEHARGVIKARAKRLKGALIELPYPSVGATENIIFAAVLAEGKTIIRNAATEPEITDLIKLLQKMGAIIEPGVNRTLYIEGVERLGGASHRIMPDRNEAVSFAALALATGGDVFVRGARQDDLLTFLNVVRRMGATYEVRDDGIAFRRKNGLKAVELETDTHPGFMTDWQAPLVIVSTQAQGTSVVHETVYEDRLGYTQALKDMGADITVFTKCLGELPCRFNGKGYPHSAVIKGPTKLNGAELSIPDIRAGLAHVVASLVAEGESMIFGIEHIERGYERFFEKLTELGVSIKIEEL